MLKVKDLPINAGLRFLFCRVCHERYSATRGDYFAADPDATPRCCNVPLALAKETKLVETEDATNGSGRMAPARQAMIDVIRRIDDALSLSKRRM